MTVSPLQQLTPAETLEDIHKTISNEPLIAKEEFDSFYCPQMNETRGNDRIGMMTMGLLESRSPRFSKSFLFGHRGVGKSTELTEIARRIADRFNVIRFSVERDLDPVNFQPFDALLLMIAEIGERCVRPVEAGGSGLKPSETMMRALWDWFAVETDTQTRATTLGAEIAAGCGVAGDSLWAKALGLFASFKGEIKHTANREEKVERYRLSRLSELIDLANRLLDECNTLLRDASNREWLFIGEDFDRYYIDKDQTERFFVSYGSMLKALHTHLVFTLPIELEYSRASQLPFPRYIVPDTPVYESAPTHAPHEKGRSAVRAVLEARVVPSLFAEGQMERLIVASGGNIRDLFTMTTYASRAARIRNDPNGKIEQRDVDASIDEMRAEYKSQLGSTGGMEIAIKTDDKIEKLKAVYENRPRCDIPDPALYSLLRSRAVQEFNGKRWFGVHPLVVDYLASIGEIKPPMKGPVPGGLI